MSNGWETSAQAWIDSIGERGDWARQHVLDPVMLGRVGTGQFSNALDVGCGEGRFCRMLKARFRRVPWFVVMEWQRPAIA